MQTRQPRVLSLAGRAAKTQWFSEPELRFANGNHHVNPKVGIPLYGPCSLATSRHKSEVHVGFIGTGEGIERAVAFYSKCAHGVDGDGDHAPFPGCTQDAGYRTALRFSSEISEPITRTELEDMAKIRNGRAKFEWVLGLLREKLRVLTKKDHPLDYIAFVVPQQMYAKCRVVDYHERGLGMVHRDLRRAFKALAMEFHKPTQLIREGTLSEEIQARDLDHITVRAWNLFTGLYFKVDGLPWGPVGLPPSTCHVGISFYRPLGESSRLRSSLAQAFDQNGEGLILRGHPFEWDEEKDGRSPHLTSELAKKLVELVLQRYWEERNHTYPERVVIHKSSRFSYDERIGFMEALRKVKTYDLVALSPRSDIRLIRAGTYPVLRGTSFAVGDMSYLYTTGYMTDLGGFPQGHVPSPLELADHFGDTPRSQLMKEILLLTKMNWNSANMYGLKPITLRFAQLVGDILREVPLDKDPSPKYKFYV